MGRRWGFEPLLSCCSKFPAQEKGLFWKRIVKYLPWDDYLWIKYGELVRNKKTMNISQSCSCILTCMTVYACHSFLTFQYNVEFQSCIFCLPVSKKLLNINSKSALPAVADISTTTLELLVKCQWPAKMSKHTNGIDRGCCLQGWILILWRASLYSCSEEVCVLWNEGTDADRLHRVLTASTCGPPATRESSDMHHWKNVTKPVKPWTDYEIIWKALTHLTYRARQSVSARHKMTLSFVCLSLCSCFVFL